MNFRQLYLPDIAVPRRLRMLKNIIALATIASLAISWRLWAGERILPHAPAFEGLPVLPLIAERIMFGCMLACSLCILLARKPAVFILLFLLFSAAMIVLDVNRLQPWMFQYVLFFFLLAFYNWRVDEPRSYTPLFNSLRICIVAFFVWDGIHKLDRSFVSETWPWMLSTFDSFISYKALSLATKAAYILPAAEILAALALFHPTMKRISIPLLVFIHLVSFVCLGPLGKNFNPAIWPWHFVMMLSLYAAFAGKAESKYYRFVHLLEFRPFYFAVLSLAVVPLLRFTALPQTARLTDFNARPANAVSVELPAHAVLKLPLYLSAFVETRGEQQHLNIEKWALHEVNSPLNGAHAVYSAVTATVKKITCCPEHVNLRFKEKSATIASL